MKHIPADKNPFRFFARPMGRFVYSACFAGLLVMPVFGQGHKPSDLDSQDFNVRRKAEIMQRVNIVLHKYKGYLFNDWMSCGREEDFRKRVYDSDVQIYIDREYLSMGDDEAAYVDSYLPKQYVNDLILRTEPRFIDPILLWHEVIHALSDDKELFTYSAPSENDKDHHYIEWAESILRTGLPKLAELETILKKYDNTPPPETERQKGQECWKQFILSYNRGNLRPIPNANEQEELRNTCGFYCDPERIKDQYIKRGSSPEFFAKPVKLSFFPNEQFNLEIHPGEEVEIRIRVLDLSTMRPPQEGQIRFEHETLGIPGDIGDPIACPCQKDLSRKWTPNVSDPTWEQVFPVRVTYDYGHRKMPGSPFLKGTVRVVPWERSLHLHFVEKVKPDKTVSNVKVRFTNAKIPDHTAPNGDVLIKELKPSSGYALEITAPGYDRRLVNNVILPAVKTKAEADAPKKLTIELESTTKPPEAPDKVKVPDLSGTSADAAGARLKSLGITLETTQAPVMNPKYPAGAVISQNPPVNAMLAVGSVVRVVLNPIPKVSIGLKVDPDKNSYQSGDEVKFIEDVQDLNPKSTYTYEWYVDGNLAGKGKTCSHTFTKPGRHYAQLVLKSSNPKENDAIIKNISVEYPPDMEVLIGFNPETNVYTTGSTVGFVAKTQNATGITEYRWYVGGEYMGSGKSGVTHTFTEDGEYEIKLGLRMGSNFDEVSETRPLVVGEPAIGTLGRIRNRFSAVGAPENLEIQSQYWRGGSGDWSKLIRFNGSTIGPVDHYILYDGDQADGYNTGFLVYAPRGKNELRFKVFHFRWPSNPKIGPSPQGIVHYEGPLPLHNKTPIPESVQFTRKASRLCDVAWRTTDGSFCQVRLSKFRPTPTLLYTGLDDLGCEEGVYPPVEDENAVPVSDTTDDENAAVESDTLADLLVSGVYRVEALCGINYPSAWTLKVENGNITGMSKWDCCPGPRNDPMKGYIDGKTVTIERDCTGQGYSGPCSQIYTGTLTGNVIKGSFTLNERVNFGTWTLYLNSKDDPSLTDSSQADAGTQSKNSDNNSSGNENGETTDSEDGPLGGGGPGSGMTDLEETPDGGSGGSGGQSDSTENGSGIEDIGGAAGNTISSGTTADHGNAPGISGTWKWFNGATAQINMDGTCHASNGNNGTWKTQWNGSEFTYTISWENGKWIDTFVLHENTLDGHNQNGTHVWGKRINSSPTTTPPNPAGNIGGSSTASVSGNWTIHQSNGFTGKLDFFQDSAGGLTGDANFGSLHGRLSGKTSGSAIEFTIQYPDGLQGHYVGTISKDGARIENGSSKASNGGSATWSATRLDAGNPEVSPSNKQKKYEITPGYKIIEVP